MFKVVATAHVWVAACAPYCTISKYQARLRGQGACDMGNGKHPGYHPICKKGPEKSASKKGNIIHTKAWKRLRLLALQRDNGLCQECLRNNRIKTATEVHHILPRSTHPELAFELSNLESLCWDCHEATKPRKRTDTLPVRIIKM